jgi:hypothetical protein
MIKSGGCVAGTQVESGSVMVTPVPAKTKKMTKAKHSRRIAEAMNRSVGLFVEVVNSLTFKNGLDAPATPLRNMTFWVGAGFSKAWDQRYPTSDELFKLSGCQLDHIADPGALARTFGVDVDQGLNLDRIRRLVYQLDMQERYPDVRARYVDEQNIRGVRAALAAAIVERFVEITGGQPFDREAEKFTIPKISPAQKKILSFFADLEARDDGSQDVVEGLRVHFISTNYDNVIETILDNVIGPDDSTFIYGYRGVSPVEIEGLPPAKVMHDHWLVRHLIKINGGFEILRRGNGFLFNYRNRSQKEVARDPPVVMLPSREQDYRDNYFKAVFPKAVRLLRDSAVLVMVGYSLTEDDALMRFIIRQFAEEPEDGRSKIVFYIDPSDIDEKLERLSDIFPYRNNQHPTIVGFQGTFNDFVERYLRAQARIQRER